jgi:hypothetical protein
VDEWAAADSTAARLTAARALREATIGSHAALEDSLAAVADAPAIRVLGAILADERREQESEQPSGP